MFVVFVFNKFHQFQGRDRKQIYLLAFESGSFPEGLAPVKGDCIAELPDIVNCNIVESSECLGDDRDKGEALPVTILDHPSDLPIVSKAQGDARLFSFPSNS